MLDFGTQAALNVQYQNVYASVVHEIYTARWIDFLNFLPSLGLIEYG
jgi:hypothetical protein